MNELIITCKVIEDLMPLYADGICSEDTRTVVEHHTAECAECRKKLADMTAELEKKAEPTSPKGNPFKKVRRHYTKLIVVTLCICAAVMIPAAMLIRMYVNEKLDQPGISFSTVAIRFGLTDVEKMIKRGEYLKLLTSAQVMYEEQYTAEETAVIKKAMAEDMERFFGEYPIKKIKAQAGLGKTSEGGLLLTLDIGDGKTEEVGLSCSFDGSTLIGLDGLYHPADSKIDFLEDKMPWLELIDKGTAEYFLSALSKGYRGLDGMLFTYSTDEISEVGDEPGVFADSKMLEIRRVYFKKLYEMLERYSYVSCEGGQVTYAGDGRFRQRAALTMTSEESGEFTAEFDVTILKYGGFSHFENVSYSDNTPQDFRNRFEEIFVNREPVWEQYQTPVLNEGNFYLNGDPDSCYIKIEKNVMKLVVNGEKQLNELFEAQGQYTDIEQYAGLVKDWSEPKEFTLVEGFMGTPLAFSVGRDGNGKVSSYACIAYYIDSDNIYMGSNAKFTRLDSE